MGLQILVLVMAALFVGYFVLEGFDFGVGMLMPFLGSAGGDDKVSPDDPRPTRRHRVLLDACGTATRCGCSPPAVLFGVAACSPRSTCAVPAWIGLITRVCAIEWRGKIDRRWRMW